MRLRTLPEAGTTMAGSSAASGHTRPPLLLLPREHGAWGIVLIPFFTAVGVSGRLTPATLLGLLAVLLVFAGRYPLELLLIPGSYVRGGRPGRRLILRSLWFYSLAAATAGVVLVVRYRLYALLWLALLGGLLFGLRVWQGRRGSERNLFAEVAGTAGLTLSGLVGWVSATGGMDRTGLVVWALNCAFFCSAIVYVKARIEAQRALHHPEEPQSAGCTMGFHLVVLLFVLLLVFAHWVTPLVVAPFVLATVRAAWGLHGRKAFTLRRLGWNEVALSLVFAGFLMLAFLT